MPSHAEPSFLPGPLGVRVGTLWPGPAPAPPSHRAACSDALARGGVPFFHWVSERKQLAELPAEGMTPRGTSATGKHRAQLEGGPGVGVPGAGQCMAGRLG